MICSIVVCVFVSLPIIYLMVSWICCGYGNHLSDSFCFFAQQIKYLHFNIQFDCFCELYSVSILYPLRIFNRFCVCTVQNIILDGNSVDGSIVKKHHSMSRLSQFGRQLKRRGKSLAHNPPV